MAAPIIPKKGTQYAILTTGGGVSPFKDDGRSFDVLEYYTHKDTKRGKNGREQYKLVQVPESGMPNAVYYTVGVKTKKIIWYTAQQLGDATRRVEDFYVKYPKLIRLGTKVSGTEYDEPVQKLGRINKIRVTSGVQASGGYNAYYNNEWRWNVSLQPETAEGKAAKSNSSKSNPLTGFRF